jgi:hypothetical protein
LGNKFLPFHTGLESGMGSMDINLDGKIETTDYAGSTDNE